MTTYPGAMVSEYQRACAQRQQPPFCQKGNSKSPLQRAKESNADQAQGSTENLITILCAKLGSSQAAVNTFMIVIRFTIKELDSYAERLLQHFSNYPAVNTVALLKFISGCRCYCTGNLSWR